MVVFLVGVGAIVVLEGRADSTGVLLVVEVASLVVDVLLGAIVVVVVDEVAGAGEVVVVVDVVDEAEAISGLVIIGAAVVRFVIVELSDNLERVVGTDGTLLFEIVAFFSPEEATVSLSLLSIEGVDVVVDGATTVEAIETSDGFLSPLVAFSNVTLLLDAVVELSTTGACGVPISVSLAFGLAICK